MSAFKDAKQSEVTSYDPTFYISEEELREMDEYEEWCRENDIECK